MSTLRSAKTVAVLALGLCTLAGAPRLTFADTAPAAPGNPPVHAGRHKHTDKWADELGLSADQRAQIRTIRQDAHARSKAIRSDTTLSDAQKKQQLQTLHKDTRTRVEAVLTPEQLEKWKQMRRAHHEERREERNENKPAPK